MFYKQNNNNNNKEVIRQMEIDIVNKIKKWHKSFKCFPILFICCIVLLPDSFHCKL